MAEIIGDWSIEQITSLSQITRKSESGHFMPYECGWYYDSPIGGNSWDTGFKIDRKDASERFNRSIKKYTLWYLEYKESAKYLIKVSSNGDAHISGSRGSEFMPYEESERIIKKIPIEVKEKIGIKVDRVRKETPKSLEHKRRRKISKEYQKANKINNGYSFYEGPSSTKAQKNERSKIIKEYNDLVTKELTNKLGIPIEINFILEDWSQNCKICIERVEALIKGEEFDFKSYAPNLDGKPVLSTNEKRNLFNILGRSRERYDKFYNEITNTLQKYRLEISKKFLHDRKMNLERVNYRANYPWENKTTKDKLKYSAITENYFPY